MMNRDNSWDSITDTWRVHPGDIIEGLVHKISNDTIHCWSILKGMCSSDVIVE